ncbi:MAG: histidine kinase [Saprospiraceae bacterium]
MYPDNNDQVIWGSCSYGYFRYNRELDTLQVFPADLSVEVYKANQHFFYHGFFKGDTLIAPSYGNGVVYFDTLLKSYQFFLFKGLPNPKGYFERVKSILPFTEDWVIIDEEFMGLGLFNLKTHEYRYQNSSTGFPYLKEVAHDMNYDRHGRIWVEKWRSRRPVLPPDKPADQYLAFFNCTSRDQSFDQVSLLHGNSLHFNYKQDSFRIEFGVVNALTPDQLEYEYRLEGVHENWQSSGKKRVILLPYILEGGNTVHVRALADGKILAKGALSLTRVIPFYYSTWFYFALVLILISIGVVLSRWRIREVRREEQKKAAYQQQLLELEAKVLKNQMNPHFIFNSLNSIKSLIQESSEEKAVHYLTRFSKFVRMVLKFSEEKLIGLNQEIEMCKYYLEIEKLRFEQSFTFKVDIEEIGNLSQVKVPPLILQPFLENAIWHGLLHKEGERQLEIRVQTFGDKLQCIVDDNGIGRGKAQEIKSEYDAGRKSFGTRLIKDRLQINEMYQNNFELEIVDKMENGQPSGTRVVLTIDID